LYGDFIIGEVVKEEKHPNADKLKICQVNIGNKIVDVVCGAPNVTKGMKAVYAPPGSTIPVNQMKLKVAKIRGVESSGMLCSEYELGISELHEGIIQMPEDSKVGSSYVDQMNLDNIMIEIGITPNRQDCLGVYGIARDLSAAGLGNLKELEVPKIPSKYKNPISTTFEKKADQKSCYAFGSRYIKNVKNCESPQWLKDKLTSIGLKPISALVDVTNYILFDYNRPLHVYDADKINGNIVVRSARKNEAFFRP
jgi:phenylalanyl-tRNA synthetase beta chain